MKVFICLDDTDNLNSVGTGKLAAQLADQIENQGWGSCRFVSRHQLLVHPDIPYTSHNSAMCFSAMIKDRALEEIIHYAGHFLERESAPGSDPGLCVVVENELVNPNFLIAFGRSAKKQVLSKEAAYNLARQLGVHLSEHGGTGQGVVGALAGVGLRLEGNDGRIKGRLEVASAGSAVRADFLSSLPQVEELRSLAGGPIRGRDLVRIGEKVKMVLLGGKAVLLLDPSGENDGKVRWRTVPRSALNDY